MNFMVYLNGALQKSSDYTIDGYGAITAINWMAVKPLYPYTHASRPNACNQGDVITVISYEGGVVVKRTDSVCESHCRLGDDPCWTSTEEYLF
jgi:hypothetical protein